MDQNSTNGTDKRSWRERLGIGAGGAGKDMPRIADEFVPASPAAKAAVKPAPMAPRPGIKAAPPRAGIVQPASEKLADKLKAQRDAQERLAEQRVQAAKSRAEIKPTENNANGADVTNGAKPKFTFAAEEPPVMAAPKPSPKGTTPVPPPPQVRPAQTQISPSVSAPKPQLTRPVAPPPVLNQASMTSPRQPLGTERPAMPTRPMPPPATTARPQQRFVPPPASGYNPTSNYGAQTPSYRSIDPGSRTYGAGGYSPPPAYVPPVGGYNNQPRLTVPPAARSGSYAAEPLDARARHLRPPARPSVGYRDDYNEADIFDDPRGQRRATAGEYSQAYRDAEHGYDEDLQPARGPWFPLMLLLVLALVAGGAVWWLYTNGAGNILGAVGGTNAPVVEAPAQPAKIVPEPTSQQPAGQPTKKLIYDRIVGDREVLGGDVIESEEVPAQPGDSTNLQEGDPGQGISDPAQPTGQEDLVPLPLPPPPGEDGSGDQQGAAPDGKTSNQAMISSAASESQAAAPSQGAVIGEAQKSDASVAKSDPPPAPAETLPVPGETLPVPGETAAPANSETIQDPAPAAPEAAPEPEAAPPPKKKVASAETANKPGVKKTTQKSLGASPVVLVPPADGAEPALEQDVASIDSSSAVGGGLYAGDGVIDPGVAAAAPAPAPVKKKRTLADLFKGESNDAPPEQSAALVAPAPAPAPAQKVQPLPVQQVATAGGYVVQLASFPNQGDASKEYTRLKAKHGAALSGLSPVVTQATVGGSIRYRLAAGTMATREQASAVCAKLFAAGERDCLVRRQ